MGRRLSGPWMAIHPLRCQDVFPAIGICLLNSCNSWLLAFRIQILLLLERCFTREDPS